MSESAKAVFLSYASQDAVAAKRIAEALRLSGVEVWLDQEGGLVGGDAWDRKIREQITACTLFVPIISANTQARHEGYFRLEWKLAEDRSHLIAKGKPFIVPVSVDGTTERGALVPDAFLAVQWTRLRQGYGGQALDDASIAAFAARVQKLLGLGGVSSGSRVGALPEDARGRGPAAPPPVPPAAPSQGPEVTAGNLEISTDVRPPLEGAFETFVPRRSLGRRALPVVCTAIVTAFFLGIAGLAVAWRLWPAAAPVTRFTVPLPEGQQFTNSGRQIVAISPDGTQMVYVANTRLFLRSMSQLDAKPIPGSEIGRGISVPVFSPDSLSIAFFSYADETLKRVGVVGGAPVTLCKAKVPHGMSWGLDGILFGQGSMGIRRVSPDGGTPETLVSVEAGAEAHGPQMLPDGRTVLFTLATGQAADRWDKARIVAQSVKSGERKTLIEGGTDARYLATGHLVYAHEGVVYAVRFDPGQLATAGIRVPVVEGVSRSASSSNGAAHFSVSATGTLIYRPGPVKAEMNFSLAFFDRNGVAERLNVPPGSHESPRLSPDGKRIAFGSTQGTIWIYDLSGASAVRRLTFDGEGNNRHPVWSADSQRVTFQSDREKELGIFWQRADGAGAAERLATAAEARLIPYAWSPDGTRLLYGVAGKDSKRELWVLSLEDKQSERFSAPGSRTNTGMVSAAFSPDGKWVAYHGKGGQTASAVYVEPFPPTGAKYQISKTGGLGFNPMWSPDGKELFYSPGSVPQLHVVSISTQPAFSFGEAVELPRPFRVSGSLDDRNYDISRDGQRFLGTIEATQATESGGADDAQIQVVLNWFDELKRRVPVK